MGHWSYLAKNQSDNPNYNLDWVYEYDELQIVFASKYMVPTLWCSLYGESDFKTCTVTLTSQRTISYPVLLTSAEIGIERSIKRRSNFCAMFSGAIDTIYDVWLEKLRLFEGFYIHMDWSDLTALSDDVDSRVKAGVRAFESNDNNDWELFLPLSNIGLDTTTQLATIGSGKSLTRSFKAECIYGFHVIKKLNSSGKMEWVDVNSKDNSEKKSWWRFWR